MRPKVRPVLEPAVLEPQKERDLIKQWLQDKRTSLWPGRGYHLTHEDELELAAEWFERTMENYREYKKGH